jgi:hypothetical protein
MSVNKTSPIAAFSAVVRALFSLQAFDRKHKAPTKLVADEGRLRTDTAREALKRLAKTGLVGTTRTLRRAVWVARKVTGEPSTSYRRDQYLIDAAHVQKLAQSDVNARELLGKINLSHLDVKRNKTDRHLFNTIVKALIAAGHKGLPIYDIVGGSFYWWLTTTSRSAANKAIQKLTGQTTLQ